FGRLPAFLFGWAELLIIRPAAYGAIAITSAEYFWRLAGVEGSTLLPGIGLSIAQMVAAVFIVLVAVVNYRGIHLGALVQNVSTVLKLGALFALVVLGLALAPVHELPEAAASAPIATLAPAAGFGLAMVSILWAYDGWADLAFVGGEVKDPQRVLPLALITGTAVVVAAYLLANFVYLHLVPLDRMAGSPLIAADAAWRVLGAAGVVFVSAAVMVSTFGTLNGSMMTGPRIFYAMAEDGLFFRPLAAVHPRFGTPAASIVLAAVLGVIFVSIRTFAELADQFIIGIWPFYALAVAAVVVLRRRRPDAERPYRVWAYPVTPAVFLVATLYLLGNYAVTETRIFATDIAVVLTGVPVYLYWTRRRVPGPDRLGG
ncbi:MAG: amino acid permease, partial [Gemmatimonadales bacterium]|nr:amino acid permease [Gemmatimonadales bacterium]